MKIIDFFALFMCFCLFNSSCSKQPVLSCDSSVNAWAYENLAYYENASRDEIVSLPLEKQAAIYVGLSGEKKILLWQEKLALVVLEGKLSNEQLIHFSKLVDFLKPFHFETDEGREEFHVFGEEWERSMREDLGCSDEAIFWLAYTWMTKDEHSVSLSKSTDFMTKVSIRDDLAGKERDCNCIQSTYCIFSGQGRICQAGNCNKVTGCGLVGNSNCNGYCD